MTKSRKSSLAQQLGNCMFIDQMIIGKRLNKISPDQLDALDSISRNIDQALTRKNRRLMNIPDIQIPKHLPIYEKAEEIQQKIREHQVVIISGETGSGKSTQLPKLCLDMNRGINGFIGHTQPRRIATRTIANRLSEELNSEIGKFVGYKIRHHQKISDDTYIKLMTDGVLLAELHKDRLLDTYDTLIIDEAHERNLNIDFILGYLKFILHKRPDLKVIITSATFDMEKFSKHFNGAPIIEVTGRSYPVDLRYRPIIDEDEEAREIALTGAIDEITTVGKGDILVFLEGEREIHEATRFIKHKNLTDTEVLPLYSRLNVNKQEKLFRPHKKRHIILATNVAETSLTIPGINFVIDFGLARLSRYSRTSKIQRLPVEKISRASADQRKGRCGRISQGVCIRIYSPEDYASRSEYTTPEILRTNLAAVILQMKALKLGEIDSFPFIDPPDKKYISDGIRLLGELSAIDNERNLTKTGSKLAKFPIDPRYGRMLLAAGELACLSELLVIVSAISIQDVKERPIDVQEKADQTHAKYADENSDFIWYINFWNSYLKREKKLSHNQLRKYCIQNFVSFVRVKEWQDTFNQLSVMSRQIGLYINNKPAGYQNIHMALAYGLLSNIGMKAEEKQYIGARNIKFNIFPGSILFKKLPKWILAAELVETNRLYARITAKIDSDWLLKPGEHLLQRSYSDPYWDTTQQKVMATEKTTLLGLPIIANKKTDYGNINPKESRIIFIKEVLINQKYPFKDGFYIHNNEIMESIRNMESRIRRPDILNEGAIFIFYDKVIPEYIYSMEIFRNWIKKKGQDNDKRLFINKETIMHYDEISLIESRYPDRIRINNVFLDIKYHFNPDDSSDGINIDVPLPMLNQVENYMLDKLVPGMLFEKIILMIKTLPKQLRKQLVPVPEFVNQFLADPDNITGTLNTSLKAYIYRIKSLEIDEVYWKKISLPDYLKMNIRVIDDDHNLLLQGRDLDELKEKLSVKSDKYLTDNSINNNITEKINDWTFGDLPRTVKMKINNKEINVFPGLTNEDNSIYIRNFDTEQKAIIETRIGVRKLLFFRLNKEIKYLRKNMPYQSEIKMLYSSVGDSSRLIDDLIYFIFDCVFISNQDEIRTKNQFEKTIAENIPDLFSMANETSTILYKNLSIFKEIQHSLTCMEVLHEYSINDINEQMHYLFFDGFLNYLNKDYLYRYPVYLQGINQRILKIKNDPGKDLKKMDIIKPYWDKYKLLDETCFDNKYDCELVEELHWMIEEFRISMFAQELKTNITVSTKVLDRKIEQININLN